jgi:hypothetical protein
LRLPDLLIRASAEIQGLIPVSRSVALVRIFN